MLDTPRDPQPLTSPLRSFLLDGILQFTRQVSRLPGVLRIALIGSLATPKPNPKDADVLVTVEPLTDLTDLARLSRQLKGRAQTRNSGADIFLAHPAPQYIGRICSWRECRPGLRLSCRARHCGRQEFLSDDLQAVKLDIALLVRPPVELWPAVLAHQDVPADVTEHLLRPLQELQRQAAPP